MKWVAVTSAWAVVIASLTAGVSAELTIVTAEDVALGVSARKTQLWLVNEGQTVAHVRLRTPHAARLDRRSRRFVALRSLPGLELQIDQLAHTIEPGARQEVKLTLGQSQTMSAGRYKLMFIAEREGTHEAVAYGSMFFTVAPVIAVGQPQIVAVDDRNDSRFVTATVRFAVSTNVQAAKVAVVAGALHRSNTLDGQLPLDVDRGVTVSPRDGVLPRRSELSFASSPVGRADMRQTQWVNLSAGDGPGVDTEVFVEVRWQRQDRAPLPAGRYTGEVKLLVMPGDES